MAEMAVIRGLRRALVAVLAGLGLLMTVVTFSPLTGWYARRLAGSWDDSRGDVPIVVSAERIDGGTLGLGSYWRSVYAGRAWREGGIRRVVVAGAGAAPLMRDFLVGHGVPAEAIAMEEKSTSTRENALNVAIAGRDARDQSAADQRLSHVPLPAGLPESRAGGAAQALPGRAQAVQPLYVAVAGVYRAR